ncbi:MULTISPECIES: potassium channel family protein [Rhodobacterales]|uniref:Two pore domain potassium channel family protein n=1 Tax=Parasulfitobacter algicola TaxID=2614809 RepID=A0ABX2IRM6_9RHOB|nr:MULTISPECIES: potassium channel family protein [Rhodobacterales]NSX55547.1 two pore domain potassium channel family protein [Sulfitobacter algicola]
MSSFQQILLGSGLLATSAIIHVLAVALSVPVFKVFAGIVPNDRRPLRRIILFLMLTIGVLVAAHTVQIWTWAVVFILISDLPDLPTSFYFATVTYTTLGYGDIVLGEGARIVATFCAITGLLTFGISTAFLIGVLSKVLPESLGDE